MYLYGIAITNNNIIIQCLSLYPLAFVCIRLKEAGDKKKKLFNIKSSSKKEQQKYYEMVLRKLQDYIALETDKGIGDEQMINS